MRRGSGGDREQHASVCNFLLGNHPASSCSAATCTGATRPCCSTPSAVARCAPPFCHIASTGVYENDGGYSAAARPLEQCWHEPVLDEVVQMVTDCSKQLGEDLN